MHRIRSLAYIKEPIRQFDYRPPVIQYRTDHERETGNKSGDRKEQHQQQQQPVMLENEKRRQITKLQSDA